MGSTAILLPLRPDVSISALQELGLERGALAIRELDRDLVLAPEAGDGADDGEDDAVDGAFCSKVSNDC